VSPVRGGVGADGIVCNHNSVVDDPLVWSLLYDSVGRS
jgi:hypothetical protein